MGAIKKPELQFAEEIMEEEEEDDDLDEFESDEVRLAEPAKNFVYDREGLLSKLEDVAWPENASWTHKLTVDCDHPDDVDVNDDLARDLAFYTQALGGTRQAFDKFQSTKMPFLRPPDYYAEMVKTDAHMLKIKGKILGKKRNMEEAEERKKAREAKKIAKEVQAQKNKERAKRKKDDIDSVKKWRKQRQQSGFAKGKDEEGPDMGLDDCRPGGVGGSKKMRPGVKPGDRSGGLRKRGAQGNKKREKKESRFGHGGRKGLKKQNTAETTDDVRTTDDMRGFNKGEGFGNKRRKRVGVVSYHGTGVGSRS